jgi:hypothetical protein
VGPIGPGRRSSVPGPRRLARRRSGYLQLLCGERVQAGQRHVVLTAAGRSAGQGVGRPALPRPRAQPRAHALHLGQGGRRGGLGSGSSAARPSARSPDATIAEPRAASVSSPWTAKLLPCARYDKRAYVFTGTVTLASIRLWLRA